MREGDVAVERTKGKFGGWCAGRDGTVRDGETGFERGLLGVKY